VADNMAGDVSNDMADDMAIHICPIWHGIFSFLFSITISPIGPNIFLAQLQISFYFFSL
jgi:hypothetical protein